MMGLPPLFMLSSDVNFEELAKRYDFAGGNIKTAVFRAAARAALRLKTEDRVITMDDFRKACDEENGKESRAAAAVSMYA